MKQNDLTILFLSCDGYRDLWKPLFYSVNKFWKDCPYPIRLGSNTIEYKNNKIQTILSGPDSDWSTSLNRILKKVETPYVFLWLDDIFPVREIDAEQFAKTLDFMIRRKAKHIHVEPKPAPDSIVDNYGVYEKGAPYRATAFGFWDVSYLSHLLISGETPWNFEIMGSYRTAYDDGFYCVMNNFIPRIHVVEKGNIFREAADYCMRHNIPLDTAKRQVLGSGSYIRSQLQKYYFNAMMNISWKRRVRAMNALRKLLISY